MKIVINSCFGNYNLSEQVIQEYIEICNLKLYKETHRLGDRYYFVPKNRLKNRDLIWRPNIDIYRNDPILIKIIEELKENANGKNSELKIIEIPDNIKYTIENYKGCEWIAEQHRTWQ